MRATPTVAPTPHEAPIAMPIIEQMSSEARRKMPGERRLKP